MKTYKQLISELRSHPELNVHKSLVDNLQPYINDPDIFITYTHDLGSKKGGAGVKVGINPQSGFNTPLGVYAYPLVEAWKLYGKKYQRGNTAGKLKVPFAGERPTVVVLRRKGKHINDIGVGYTSKDWDTDISRLKGYFVDKWSKKFSVSFDNEIDKITEKDVDVKNLISLTLNFIIDKAMSTSRSNTIGGKFWNITRILSYMDTILFSPGGNIYVMFGSDKDGPSLLNPDNLKGHECRITIGRTGIEFIIPNNKIKNKYNISDDTVPRDTTRAIFFRQNHDIVSWNHIFRVLGYESIADRSGSAIIHESEPTQAVFFSSKGYTVVDAFDNVGTKKDVSSSWIFSGIKSGDIKVDKNSLYQISPDSGDLVWKNGRWLDGTWEKGTWNNGAWENGTWKDGTWKEGTWIDGIWKKGTWLGGTWKGGVWENGGWKYGTWNNGTWKKGTWRFGVWKDGTWKDGTWEGGTWRGGTWKGGTWKGGIWQGGTWEGGTWQGGYYKEVAVGNFHKAGDSPDKWSK